MLQQNINEINTSLDKYKNLSHDELFTFFVDEKLKGALSRYEVELENLNDYLLRKNANIVFKRLTELQKDKDKEALDKAVKEKGDRADE